MIAQQIEPFGTISIYHNYIIVVVNEGETMVPAHLLVFQEIVKTYFKNKKFGYITHRIHSYAVDVNIYHKTSKIENLIAFAVVSNLKLSVQNVELEKRFLKKPFRHCLTIEEAIHWVEKMISDSN